MKEKTLFVKTFGDIPLVRVLDFLLCEGLYFEYSLSEIAKHSGVSWSTFHEILPKLQDLDLVRQTRTVGRAKLFRTNAASPIIKKLVELDLAISSRYGKPLALAIKRAKRDMRVSA